LSNVSDGAIEEAAPLNVISGLPHRQKLNLPPAKIRIFEMAAGELVEWLPKRPGRTA
jgi:hypothetical protein